MKRILLSILLFCFGIAAVCADERVGKSYRFIGYGAQYQIKKPNDAGSVFKSEKELLDMSYAKGFAQSTHYVTYVSKGTIDKTSYILFRYWTFDDKGRQQPTENKKITMQDYTKYNGEYFLMTESDFDDFTIEVSNRMQFSALTVPIKLRLKPFDFSENAGLGAALLYKPRRLRSTNLMNGVSFALGAGLTNVSLDSTNTRGEVESSAIGRAFSYYAGVIYTLGDINLCLLFGADNVAARDTRKWTYQNDMWIGLGFGLQFSSLSGKEK